MNAVSWILLIIIVFWAFAAIRIVFFGGFRKGPNDGRPSNADSMRSEFTVDLPCSECSLTDCVRCAGSANKVLASTEQEHEQDSYSRKRDEWSSR